MEGIRERVVVEPDSASLDVEGQHAGAQTLEARWVLREHTDRSAGPQPEEPLDRDLKHRRVPVVQEVMRIRLDEDPRAISHSSQITPRREGRTVVALRPKAGSRLPSPFSRVVRVRRL